MLYHSAICDAARQRDWKVVLHPRGEELAMAAAALHASTDQVERFVNDLKQTLKAPWTAEHRDAFAAAIGSLGKLSRLRVPKLIETMDDKASLLRHFLGALAYRTQKALRDAPADFGRFRAGGAVRTPSEIVRHMTSVLGYARACYVAERYRPDDLPSLDDEVSRFHGMLEDLARHIDAGTELRDGMTPERLLQGPLADAMTHAGQLAMLRRLAGSPVPPEDFSVADIQGTRLGPEQAGSGEPGRRLARAPTPRRRPRHRRLAFEPCRRPGRA